MGTEGLIFDIDNFAVHDGPGLRMAVYLKGCPLRCAWCHSPESLSPRPELVFVADRCVGCGACAAACERAVHEVAGPGTHRLDRTRCTACGACVWSCRGGALAIKGSRVGSDAIVARAARLKPFLMHSGGGVTLTGGEVTAQSAFAAAVLAGCKAEGLHTAIETCGACGWEKLAALLPHTDLVLYDLKLMNDEEHRRWTGRSNRTILRNARRLAALAQGDGVVVRIPLIPGITDTEENLRAVFSFMRKVGLRAAELLPYNPATGAKYEWLGLSYPLHEAAADADQAERAQRLAEEMGIAARAR